ncbi:molybdopterin-guanine dinucleotide biosynthesis protein A [Tateyamaria omphalii]|uniref:nucleotidyltransferase family protein n=1 Tax=Tateyamaria omphalii TaxID=299262 RepID=UPI00167467FC|nr:nucleotidyltransferase family protein [Tateyamaria omphalii]GGX46561.1 molybdopterin-guanine dinucleotide biosynthesis protein A [Tateyamaria omphalii]
MMPILILAAGAASRMRGTDKLLEDVGGQSLLAKQVKAAQAVSTDVRVALPPAPHPRYAIVERLGARPVEVSDAAEGMGASLRTIFATLGPQVRYAMLLLGDLPDITDHDLRTVQKAAETHPEALIWRGATESGRGGHPIIFDRMLFPAFDQLCGDDGGRDIVRQAGNRVHMVPLPGSRARLDLDSPEDWAAWRAARHIT